MLIFVIENQKLLFFRGFPISYFKLSVVILQPPSPEEFCEQRRKNDHKTARITLAHLTACFLEQWAEAHWNIYTFFIDPQFLLHYLRYFYFLTNSYYFSTFFMNQLKQKKG